MKYIAIAALVATTQASTLGDDCWYNADMCLPDGLWCATWEDSQYGEMASCEECTDGVGQMISDSYGDLVEYVCPPESFPQEEAAGGGGAEPAPAAEAPVEAAPSEEEGSMKLMASTVAVAALMLGNL
tara:strand:+ start:78 stop:461 length:384 start_codon:yes stop_codon:yes gene_type:complete